MKRSPALRFTGLLCFALLAAGCNRGDGTGKGNAYPATDRTSETADTASGMEAVREKADRGGDLRQAAMDGELEKVRELVDAGTSVQVSDAEGHTPLMLASFNGHSRIVLYLLNHGADLHARDRMDRTALLYAATGPFPETVSILLERGAEPNITDSNEGFSPLMHAAAEGNLEVVRILMEAGADPGMTDVDGDDARTFAEQAGHSEVEEYIATHH